MYPFLLRVAVAVSGVAFFACLPAAAQVAYDIGTVVGGGSQVSGPPRSVKLYNTIGVAVEADGSLLVVDGNRILRLTAATNQVSVIAGDPDVATPGGFSGDGGPATAALLNGPERLALDAVGNIFFGDAINNRVRRIDRTTGFISTVAGTGTPGFSGDGGQATDASLNFPRCVTLDSTGALFIADTNNDRIRRVDPVTGTITTFAGGGLLSSDGIIATDSALFSPSDVFAAPDGYLYIYKSGYIRRIALGTNLLYNYVGTGALGDNGDGHTGINTMLSGVGGLAMDPDGNLLIVETGRDRVRRVDKATTAVTTIAGRGSVFNIDGGGTPAVDAALDGPRGIAAGANGAIYFGGGNNVRVFKLMQVPFGITEVRSVKNHASVGPFDVLVDRAAAIYGPVTVEPRAIGGGHNIVFRFNAFLASISGVTVVDQSMSSIGNVTTSRSDNEIALTLSNVPDKSRVTMTLEGINGGPNFSTSMGFLVGDVDGNGSITSADVSAIRFHSGQTTNSSNFKLDLNVSGVVGAADIAKVKARMGATLPTILPTITSAAPATATTRVAYFHAFTASQPIPLNGWAVATGTLPIWATLNSNTGVLSGIPSLTDGGTSTFSISATNANGTGTQNVTFSVILQIAPAYTSAAPPAGIIGWPYSFAFTASGIPAPTFSLVAGGTLPASLTLSSAGVLSGMPSTAGTYTFAVQATNTGGSARSPVAGTHSVTIAAPVGGPTASIEGTVIPIPSKFAGIRPAAHAGINGAGRLYAWAVNPARCDNTQPAITSSWHHNIDFTNHRLQGQIDFFDMAPNESITYEFVPTGADVASGAFFIGTNGQLPLPANFASISTKPCDFDLTKLVPGPTRDYCFSTAPVDNQLSYTVTTGAAPFTCKMTPGQKYYFNLRWQNGSPGGPNTSDACAAIGLARCGVYVQIR